MADNRSKPPVSRPKAWRPNQASPATDRPGPSRRGKKIFAVVAVMLALAGAAVGFLLYISPFRPPVFLSLPITEYSDRRLSPNAFGQQDGEALLKHFPGNDSGIAFHNQEGDLLREKLGELKNRKEDALVLHLSSLAICRGGKVYLLPANADADRPDTWLPLDTLLESVRACPAGRKLLLLDVMKPLANPHIGVLQNEVAARVEQAVQAMPDLGCWVLCACSPGQVSLASEELHRSIFAYYLDLGLRGFADTADANAKPNGRITVRKLAAYVGAHVDRWAKSNRGVRQMPLLLGNGLDDFELAVAEKTPEPAAEEPAEEYPKPLQDGWARRDSWLPEGRRCGAPGAVRNLDATLLWAEQRWRAGFAFPRVADELTNSLNRSQRQMDNARGDAGPRLRSLFLAVVAAKQEPDEETRESLKALARDAANAAKAAEPAAKQALDANKTAFLKKLEGKPLTVAEAVFLVASSDPQVDKVRFLADLLRSVQPTPQYAETAQLQRLAEIDPKKWPAESQALSLLLKISRKREHANCCDPDLLPWIKARLQKAAARQLESEVLLFQGNVTATAQAADKLQEADRGFDACLDALGALQKARVLVDRAMEFLPGDVPYLANLADVSESDERAWQEAVRACRELFELLGQRGDPINSGSGPAEDLYGVHQDALRRAATTLGERLETLSRPFSETELSQLRNQSAKPDASPVILLRMHARLATPLLKVNQRLELWKTAGTFARQLQARMEAADGDKERPFALVAPFEESDRRRLENMERKSAALRTRLSLGLLYLAGVGKPELEQTAAQLEQKTDDAALETLGNKLQLVWSREIPERLQELLRRGNLSEADALNRVMPPFDDPPSARYRESLDDPAAMTRLAQEHAARRWLSGYYRETAKNYPDASAAAAFYLSAADDFLHYAR